MSALSARTRPAAAAAPLALFDRWKEALFLAILAAFWIGTDPFYSPEPLAPGQSASSLINQLTYLALAGAAIAAVAHARAGALRPLLQPSYAIMLALLLVSLFQSIIPLDALRGLIFTLIAMGLAASLFALPRDAERFRLLLFYCAAAVVALSWFGVIAMPGLAIHSDFDPLEPEHAGSWRGHFTHKNIAGAMMAIMAIIGLYAARSGRRWLGLGLMAAAALFLYATKSKTSQGLLPVVIALVVLAERIPFLVVRLGLLVGPVLALNALTLGSALSPAIRAFNQALLSDPSFTGRYDIWRFAFEKLAERPWTGFGYESFWPTEIAKHAESKLELAWGVVGIVHGHNSYLDMAVALGWPGLAVVAYVFVLKPVLDYHRCRPGAPNRQFASACLMIWLFVSLCMCLEVFYFRRVDPVWLSLVFAVIGLRLAASHRLAGPEPAESR